VTAGLTAATLYVVSYGFEMRVWESFRGELHSSVKIYETFARERESSLVRSAQMLANLPNVRALMTTEDAATIQDESASIWRMSGGDLLVLAYRSGEIAGLQTSGTDFGRAQAQESLQASIQNGESRNWWFGGEHLYELWAQPIYFGAAQPQNVRGILAVGHEINENRARDFSRVVLSEVIFRSGESVATTTLPGMEDSRSAVPASLHVAIEGDLPGEFDYRNARYLGDNRQNHSLRPRRSAKRLASGWRPFTELSNRAAGPSVRSSKFTCHTRQTLCCYPARFRRKSSLPAGMRRFWLSRMSRES
jgi:hypothetical protein